MKKLLPMSFLCFAVAFGQLSAQQKDTVTTFPTPGATTSSYLGITFEVNSTKNIQVNNLEVAMTTTGDIPVDIYYREGGVQHNPSTVPLVDSVNGWHYFGVKNVPSVLKLVPAPTDGDMDLILPPGRHGFFLYNPNYDINFGLWHSGMGMDTTFTHPGAALTIYTGPDNGYLGTGPVFISTDTAQFIGSVIYTELPHLNDEISVKSIEILDDRCPGNNNVLVNLRNLGTTQITSLDINWRIKGTSTINVFNYSSATLGIIDTIGGLIANGFEKQVNIGTVSLTANDVMEIEVWSSSPNGKTDPIPTNDSASAIIHTAMTGIYTIDPGSIATTNFTSFNAAIDALYERGVCGPVTFNVAADDYNEQVTIGPITGTSATNTVTFRPDANSAGNVHMKYAAAGDPDNFVVKFDGCSYVTFDGIKMTNNGANNTTAIVYEGPAHHITIRNCELYGPAPSPNTGTDFALIYTNNFIGTDYNVIEDNYLYGGSFTIYYRGESSTNRSKGVRISGNTVVNSERYGIILYESEDSEVSYNTITSASTYSSSSYGLYVRYGRNTDIIGNVVNSPAGWPRYGMYLRNNEGTNFNSMLIANNMIHVGDATNPSTYYGIYNRDGDHLSFVHNNIVVEGTSPGSNVIYMTKGTNYEAYNNNLLNYGMGYAIYADSGSFVSDYNNLATNGSNLCAFIGGRGAVADLATWKLTGNGQNSLNVDSIYSNLDSLRTCTDSIHGMGAPLGYPARDIDGEVRSATNPTIGADEYELGPTSIDIGDTITICPGEDLVLRELSENMKYGTYTWSTNAKTPTITVNTAGTYSLTMMACVSATDDVEVVEHPAAVAAFTASTDTAEIDDVVGFTNNSSDALRYEWDFGDGTTSSSQNESHSYDSVGTYTVTLTAYGICDTVTETTEITVVDFTGMGELTANQVKIYPNPAKDHFYLELGRIESEGLQVMLLNMKGQVVYDQRLNTKGNSRERINVGTLDNGIYIVRLIAPNGVVNKQIVKQ